MSSFLERLRADNAKKGLFTSDELNVSYPLGFPVLDEMLGARYIRRMPNGEVKEDIHRGVPCGSFVIFAGQSSSGKTTAAIQAAANIVEPFGELGIIIHEDAEKSTTYDRVQSLTGWSNDKIKACYNIDRSHSNLEDILVDINKMAERKELEGDAMKYNTGQLNIWGEEYRCYIPSCVIVDSLGKLTSKNEATDIINGLMSGGRNAIYNGIFFRNALDVMYKYNIIVFVIVHEDDDMPSPNGIQKAKQMTFMRSGKRLAGGAKTRNFTSSIVSFFPKTTKEDISTEEEDGFNGVTTVAYVVKSRVSKGGFGVTMDFVQESGFDPRMTLLRFAQDNGLISGRNPKSYFTAVPDVKFDTRIMLKEMAQNPQITVALFNQCAPLLHDIIPVVDITDDSDIIRGGKGKLEIKQMLRDYLSADKIGQTIPAQTKKEVDDNGESS